MFLEDFAKLNKSSRYSILAGLIIISSLAIYNWMISPHTAYLSASQKYEKALDKRDKTNKIILTSLKLKQDKLQQLQQELENLNNTAFSQKQSQQFWSELKKLTENAGCYLNSLTKFEEEKNTNSAFTTESAELNISGSYNSIMQIVKQLNQSPKKIWIDSLNLETMQKSSILECDMTITIQKLTDREIK
jgi:Tfp pilus assembly protein PilO